MLKIIKYVEKIKKIFELFFKYLTFKDLNLYYTIN